LKLTTPPTVPEVAGSIVIVAAFGAAAGCSVAGWDLLQPASTLSERVISVALKKILISLGRKTLVLSV
jgi:hypothetical protein